MPLFSTNANVPSFTYKYTISSNSNDAPKITVSTPSDKMLYIKAEEVIPKPKRVIFNGLATICFWEDGSKTMVKMSAGEDYDQETAVAMCIAHKLFGSKNQFKKFVKSGYDQSSEAVKKKTKK
jgi:DNA/RNA-binding domain of Phe-tRNA-synthetase-like protein